MKIRPVVVSAFVAGIAIATIAYNPRKVMDVCNVLFNNTIAKSAGIGLVLGAAITGIELFRPHRSKPVGMAAYGGALMITFSYPVIGLVGGALVGSLITGSRHVTIGFK